MICRSARITAFVRLRRASMGSRKCLDRGIAPSEIACRSTAMPMMPAARRLFLDRNVIQWSILLSAVFLTVSRMSVGAEGEVQNNAPVIVHVSFSCDDPDSTLPQNFFRQ